MGVAVAVLVMVNVNVIVGVGVIVVLFDAVGVWVIVAVGVRVVVRVLVNVLLGVLVMVAVQVRLGVLVAVMYKIDIVWVAASAVLVLNIVGSGVIDGTVVNVGDLVNDGNAGLRVAVKTRLIGLVLLYNCPIAACDNGIPTITRSSTYPRKPVLGSGARPTITAPLSP